MLTLGKKRRLVPERMRNFEMSYDVQMSEEHGILVVRVGGERYKHVDENFRAVWAIWSDVAAEMKRLGLRHLLAVVSTVGPPRSLAVSAFFRRLAEMGYVASMRLAVVAKVPTRDRYVIELGIATARQDGWTIRLFASEPEAMVWLPTSEE